MNGEEGTSSIWTGSHSIMNRWQIEMKPYSHIQLFLLDMTCILIPQKGEKKGIGAKF